MYISIYGPVLDGGFPTHSPPTTTAETTHTNHPGREPEDKQRKQSSFPDREPPTTNLHSRFAFAVIAELLGVSVSEGAWATQAMSTVQHMRHYDNLEAQL